MGILQKFDKNVRPAAWQAVLGAIILHFSLGAINLWGNIGFYITSYLRYCGHNVEAKDTIAIFSSTMIGQGIGIISCRVMCRYMSDRKLALFGGLLLVTSNLVACYMTTLIGFIIVYGFMFGMSVGIALMAPMSIAFSWFPNCKGFVGGCIVAGFGVGAAAFNFLATHIVNPYNVPLIVEADGKFFGPEVSANVPKMFAVLGFCHLALVLFSNFLLQSPPVMEPDSYESIESVTDYSSSDEVLEQLKVNETTSLVKHVSREKVECCPAELPFTVAFWVLVITFVSTAIGGCIVGGSYKKFGLQYFDNDAFLTFAGSAACLSSSLGRIFWGLLADKAGIFKTLILISLSHAILLLSFPFAGPIHPSLFLLWMCLLFGSVGGNFALYPMAVLSILGETHAGANYSVVLGSFAILAGPLIFSLAHLPGDLSYLFSGGICAMGCIASVVQAYRFKL